MLEIDQCLTLLKAQVDRNWLPFRAIDFMDAERVLAKYQLN